MKYRLKYQTCSQRVSHCVFRKYDVSKTVKFDCKLDLRNRKKLIKSCFVHFNLVKLTWEVDTSISMSFVRLRRALVFQSSRKKSQPFTRKVFNLTRTPNIGFWKLINSVRIPFLIKEKFFT